MTERWLDFVMEIKGIANGYDVTVETAYDM